jgi:hypothetical protein
VTEELRREADKGPWARFWEWIDHRRVDMHTVLAVSLWLTVQVVQWSMDFADAHPEMDADKMYKVIGAVIGPWVLLQGAMFKFYADSRKA